MALRSIGSATVAFGMVSIPVKLYGATTDNAIKFNMLTPSGSRVKQKLVSESTGEEVKREETLKGYEYAKGQYVIFSAEEIKSLEDEATHTAEIVEFVPERSVDPLFYDKPYYLAPAPGGAKPYVLLLRAMRDSGKVAIGKWVSRGKQHIVMIRPAEEGEDALVMQTLLYEDEVRGVAEVDVPKTEVKEAELELAKTLIANQMSDAFDPARYKDEYRERAEAIIQKKIAGEEIKIVAPGKPAVPVVDMMAALSASIAAQKAKGGEKPAAAPAAAPGSTGQSCREEIRQGESQGVTERDREATEMRRSVRAFPPSNQETRCLWH